MKIFIDTGKLDEIEKAYSYGILDGVTTNPSLMKKAIESQKGKLDLKNYVKKILKVARGTPVSLEVLGDTYHEMVSEGKRIYKMFNPVAKNVYIKIPVNPSFRENVNNTFDGIKAIKTLSKSRIPVNCTLIFTPEQALIAAKAGAKFVSPFAGRIDDYLRTNNKIKFKKEDYYPAHGWVKKGKLLSDNGIVSGVDLVAQCVDIMKRYNLKTKVLAASLRNPWQVREMALTGADIVTLPFNILEQMMQHHKTREGVINFTKDIVPAYKRIVKGK